MQRPDRMPGADRLVGGLGRQPRVLAIDVDKGVKLLVCAAIRASNASMMSTGESRPAAISSDKTEPAAAPDRYCATAWLPLAGGNPASIGLSGIEPVNPPRPGAPRPIACGRSTPYEENIN